MMMAVHKELVFRLSMHVEAIIPVHQMSTSFPWPLFFMTSGAM